MTKSRAEAVRLKCPEDGRPCTCSATEVQQQRYAGMRYCPREVRYFYFAATRKAATKGNKGVKRG